MELACQRWPAKNQFTTPHTTEPKIVFLHGMAGIGKIWRPVAAALENHYSILAPDQRGHGGSRDAKGTFTARDFAQDLQDTLEAQHFHPAFIVGHSMGVRTACAFHHLKPEWVQGLVLIDIRLSASALDTAKSLLYDFLKDLPERFANRESARAYLLKHAPDPSLPQFLMAVSENTPSGELAFPFQRSALLQILDSNEGASLLPWLDEAVTKKTPTLFLRGMKSRFWEKNDFEADKNRYAGVSNFEFKEVPDAGHGLPFEKRAEFISILTDWIGKTLPFRASVSE